MTERDEILASLKDARRPETTAAPLVAWEGTADEKRTVVGEYEAWTFRAEYPPVSLWAWVVYWLAGDDRLRPSLPVEYGPRGDHFGSSRTIHAEAVKAAREHQARTTPDWVVLASDDTEPWWKGRPVRTRRTVALDRAGPVVNRTERDLEIERAAFVRQGREPRV